MSATKCRCGKTLERHCRTGCSSCTSGFRCPTHGKDWAQRTGGGFFSSGRTGSGAKCRKCGRQTVNCSVCKGVAGKTHGQCRGTGQVCPEHDGYWK